jgi:hypothetical protein
VVGAEAVVAAATPETLAGVVVALMLVKAAVLRQAMVVRLLVEEAVKLQRNLRPHQWRLRPMLQPRNLRLTKLPQTILLVSGQLRWPQRQKHKEQQRHSKPQPQA